MPQGFARLGPSLTSFAFLLLVALHHSHHNQTCDDIFALFPPSLLPLLPLFFLPLFLNSPPFRLMASTFRGACYLSLAVFFKGPWVLTLALSPFSLLPKSSLFPSPFTKFHPHCVVSSSLCSSPCSRDVGLSGVQIYVVVPVVVPVASQLFDPDFRSCRKPAVVVAAVGAVEHDCALRFYPEVERLQAVGTSDLRPSDQTQYSPKVT